MRCSIVEPACATALPAEHTTETAKITGRRSFLTMTSFPITLPFSGSLTYILPLRGDRRGKVVRH
jgi:hypothetical protein